MEGTNASGKVPSATAIEEQKTNSAGSCLDVVDNERDNKF